MGPHTCAHQADARGPDRNFIRTRASEGTSQEPGLPGEFVCGYGWSVTAAIHAHRGVCAGSAVGGPWQAVSRDFLRARGHQGCAGGLCRERAGPRGPGPRGSPLWGPCSGRNSCARRGGRAGSALGGPWQSGMRARASLQSPGWPPGRLPGGGAGRVRARVRAAPSQPRLGSLCEDGWMMVVMMMSSATQLLSC